MNTVPLGSNNGQAVSGTIADVSTTTSPAKLEAIQEQLRMIISGLGSYVNPATTVADITEELRLILADMVTPDNTWASIFQNHCKRTGKPIITDRDVTMEYVPSYGKYYFVANWMGRKYEFYDNSQNTGSPLYREVMMSVIVDELAQNRW